MASLQTADEITTTLERLHGKRIVLLQVLGINSLKSLTPSVDVLVGETVETSEAVDRVLTLRTGRHLIRFDLQRTGKVVWLRSNESFHLGAGSMPTARLITEEGAIDLTEPAKTKRITVTVDDR
ncbi:hypothetical protein LWF01_05550 [Saxibacter everestensis]|uniref:Uncharacterized protein n=1 Tax=Saxibacter everestensis TaxID=2909229 RepID=A0ABY8QW20_9MICO|nr:hypothetical protein LWF01_05550 [Brevibacteriaceae bacterium ZFBP1038]